MVFLLLVSDDVFLRHSATVPHRSEIVVLAVLPLGPLQSSDSVPSFPRVPGT